MPSLGIVGTGLIGASIGLRAKKNGMRVVGFDIADAAREALGRGAIDEMVTREQLYASCEFVAIAAPVEATCSELRSLSGLMLPWQLLIDVASVKRVVVKAADGVRNFVATHPLAGNEGHGPSCASANLFDGCAWAYVPSGNDLDARFEDFARSFGAQPFAVGARRHDEVVALTSHLPQLVAFELAPRIRAGGPEAELLCGPAGREILRLGESNPELWREIFAANADRIEIEAASLCESLARASTETS
jgi:prephenate dehydrogenase